MTEPTPLNIPTELTSKEEGKPLHVKWCEGHWATLMFALQDRGLSDQIAESPEELSAKLAKGQGDPCWEACNIINIGAFEIFGADKVMKENNGCPACAFANMVQHAADMVRSRHGVAH